MRIEGYHELNIKNRPYSSEASSALMPRIKEWYAKADSTIWECLGKESDAFIDTGAVRKLTK